MGFVPSAAKSVRECREQVPTNNVFWQAQQWTSNWIETSLNIYRDMRDQWCETLFHTVYGSPGIQALAGLKASEASPRRRPGVDSTYRTFVAHRIEQLKWSIREGGAREAAIRAALYIRLPEGMVDERGFRLFQKMREEAGAGLTLAEFKKVVRDQFLCLLLDQRRAIAAIPAMMGKEPDLAKKMVAELRRLLDVVGIQSETGKARLAEIEALIKEKPSVARRQAEAVPAPAVDQAKRPQLRRVGEPD
jgi:uncharacterized protein DUF3141